MTNAGGRGVQQLSTTVGGRDGVAVVRVTGELDLYSLMLLRECLDGVVADANGAPRLVVDLTGLTFMDSSGLGELVLTQKKVTGLEGSFGVVCSGGPVLRLFDITGLAEALQVSATVDGAVARALQEPQRG